MKPNKSESYTGFQQRNPVLLNGINKKEPIRNTEGSFKGTLGKLSEMRASSAKGIVENMDDLGRFF